MKLAEHSSALVGFAVLRANYNASAPSYIDNFRGFVLGVLAEHQPNHLTRDVISSSIQESFGIAIPDLVVDKIIKRTKSASLIDVDGTGYFLTQKGSQHAPAVRSLRDKYVRQQRELEDRLRAYIDLTFPERKGLLDTEISEELSSYLERHAVPLMASSFKGRSLPVPTNEDTGLGFDFLISRFVAHLAERDSIGFGYLEEAAKGAILASVVSLDTSSFQNSLNKVSVYLDTPVLIDLLGFGGSVTQRATAQLLELLKLQGASVRAFSHSMRELDGVLHGAEEFARINKRHIARPIDLHFQSQGMSAVDIELTRLKAAEFVEALEIEVVDKPGDYRSYGLDEVALDDALQNAVHYKSDNTRRFDVDSLSAIHRIRKGSSRGTLDRCIALLLTDNIELVHGAESIDEKHDWPLAMTDSALAGILWARSPALASDLPRHMVLASAYAGMQPDPHLWGRYVDEVDTLESRGTVSADEAILLRSTSAGRDAMMEETLGLEVTPVSPVAVLRRIEEKISEPVLADLRSQVEETLEAKKLAEEVKQKGTARADDLLNQLQAAELEKETAASEFEQHQRGIDEAIHRVAERRARKRIRVGLWIFVSLLVIATGLKLVGPAWLDDVPDPISWAIAALALIAAALAIIDAVGKGTLSDWLVPLERRMANHLVLKRRRELGIASSPDLSLTTASPLS